MMLCWLSEGTNSEVSQSEVSMSYQYPCDITKTPNFQKLRMAKELKDGLCREFTDRSVAHNVAPLVDLRQSSKVSIGCFGTCKVMSKFNVFGKTLVKIPSESKSHSGM